MSNGIAAWPAGAPSYTLPFAEYDDDEDGGQEEGQTQKEKEKMVRRRSSKACDQCRKSKCKCERAAGAAPGAPCRSCVVLGTECTFLGPSRKRGPPKGYIDAIEARLHQTEALVGIVLAAALGPDERARGLIWDLREDPLARAILARIDQSAYGPGGRGLSSALSRALTPSASNSNSSINLNSPLAREGKERGGDGEIGSTHPSHEWMDRVTAHVLSRAREARSSSANNHNHNIGLRHHSSNSQMNTNHNNNFDSPPSSNTPLDMEVSSNNNNNTGTGNTTRARPRGPGSTRLCARRRRMGCRRIGMRVDIHLRRGSRIQAGSMALQEEDSSNSMGGKGGGADGLAGAVGQLSLNEEKQVRYHGKVSGLHLLARQARTEGQNKGGIWRFPKARVWPAAPARDAEWEAEAAGEVDKDGLPPRATQEALLARYFACVHPSFPVVHKRAVMEGFKGGSEGFAPRPPPLLLLAMFALAARHAPHPVTVSASSSSDSTSATPTSTNSVPSTMWPAGDAFLFRAKALLDSSYASSRASTCQALLLMGFREIGIGAMAQAWIYIGMAVRMAQDLGMQRDADGWVRAGVRDGKLFDEWEIAERRRVWYACVIMDKYVSTYIGRPLAIFERDFDTSLPSESDEWAPPADAPVTVAPRAGRVISCFNASARLAGILSQIVQSIYALRPASSRHAELVVLDGQLEKWFLALPVHLRHDPAVRAGEVPLPQVLTLHMQYWCAVLLLHRPFSSPAPEEGDVRGNAEKSYELCAGAANHITTIATLYSETYTLKHSPVFHCYYIFTASIMHVVTLSQYPTDPQARLGLTRCMDALAEMQMVWPSAARALVLLRGAQATLADAEADMSSSTNTALSSGTATTRKRAATQTLDDSFTRAAPPDNFLALRPFAPVYQPNGHFAVDPRSEAAYYPPPASPYERWSADGAGPGAASGVMPPLAFQGALSTAVMGPAYSTGLVDERQHRAPPPEGEPRFAQQQYWADYGAFPQINAGYEGLVVHPPESQMYPLHDQYNMYTQ
ncbi:fungal-specific transcription factor domain-containing protein [Mycena crocata]|nr:fungal-specific transcription factor domain-containing protein [Mycena crocata]